MAEKPTSIIEGVSAFFISCPLLRDGVFRIDALGDDPTEYAITIGSFDPIIESYIDGSSDRRYQFAFESREAYDMDRVNNIANSSFYEQFADWIESRNAAGEMPSLPAGCHPETIRPLGSGFLFDENGEAARYQIQVEMTYHKDA